MPRLTTHALDTARGLPAAHMRVDLLRDGQLIVTTHLDHDGRTSSPLLEDEAFTPGNYALHFHVRDYFLLHQIDSPFLHIVPIHFTANPHQSYHIPLVVSPFAYSSYRGS